MADFCCVAIAVPTRIETPREEELAKEAVDAAGIFKRERLLVDVGD